MMRLVAEHLRGTYLHDEIVREKFSRTGEGKEVGDGRHGKSPLTGQQSRAYRSPL